MTKEFKQILLKGIQDCITAYFLLNDDCYNSSRTVLKKEYEGSIEDYSGYEKHGRFEAGTDGGFWGLVGDTLHIAFRGTHDSAGWALNFCATSDTMHAYDDKPYGVMTGTGVKMHSGFLYGWKECRAKIFELITSSNPKNIIIKGHSRGAALAQCCAIDLQYNNMAPNISVYLFAPPRVFNEAGKVSYDKRVPNTWRIENANDPVPFTPPDWMGYRPVGKLIKVNVDFFQTIAPTNWLAPMLEFLPILPVQISGTLFRGFSAVDHYPKRYEAGIKKLSL